MTGTERNAENTFLVTERYGAGVDPAGWQPISAAPDNGTRVFLGVVRKGQLEEIHIGRWSGAINDDEISCWWSDQCDDEIVPHVWMPFVALPTTPETGHEQ